MKELILIIICNTYRNGKRTSENITIMAKNFWPHPSLLHFVGHPICVQLIQLLSTATKISAVLCVLCGKYKHSSPARHFCPYCYVSAHPPVPFNSSKWSTGRRRCEGRRVSSSRLVTFHSGGSRCRRWIWLTNAHRDMYTRHVRLHT